MYNNPLSNAVKFVIGGVWNGLVWFYRLFFSMDEIPQETNGRVFKQEFE